MTVPQPDAPRLEASGISKRFPGVLANDRIDFAVAPGEIHALLGENGAGKSTLVKIIYGVLHPDAGTLRWNGEAVEIADPHAARALGIGMVFQHFSLFEAMTVLENVSLGLDKVEDRRTMAARVGEVQPAYGRPHNPARGAYSTSARTRLRSEIIS